MVQKKDEQSPVRRVFDLHCDTLDRIVLGDSDVFPGFSEQNASIPSSRRSSLSDNDLHVSLRRMEGIPWCQCFAAFIPDPIRGLEAYRLFEDVHGFFQSELLRHQEQIKQVTDARDIESILDGGACAALLTIEGASMFEGTLDYLEEIDGAGVKMVTLTWNGQNAIGSGNETPDGLTRFGKDAIRALEERNIVIDVSHLNDTGFKDVIQVAKRPFAASHSNARAICPHPRNLTDDQFRSIVDCSGIVGLNFCNTFLVEAHQEPTVDDMLFHVDHWLELGGINTVALGSDFDGCDVPSWLSSIEKTTGLGEILAKEFGYAVADRICFSNAYEFFLQNETI